MNRENDALRPLKDVIAGLFRDGVLPFNPDDARIFGLWEETVGEAIAAHAHPSWVRQGVLKVDVSDPIWLQELEYMAEDIRASLNRKMGRDAVQKIQFRMGGV